MKFFKKFSILCVISLYCSANAMENFALNSEQLDDTKPIILCIHTREWQEKRDDLRKFLRVRNEISRTISAKENEKQSIFERKYWFDIHQKEQEASLSKILEIDQTISEKEKELRIFEKIHKLHRNNVEENCHFSKNLNLGIKQTEKWNDLKTEIGDLNFKKLVKQMELYDTNWSLCNDRKFLKNSDKKFSELESEIHELRLQLEDMENQIDLLWDEIDYENMIEEIDCSNFSVEIARNEMKSLEKKCADTLAQTRAIFQDVERFIESHKAENVQIQLKEFIKTEQKEKGNRIQNLLGMMNEELSALTLKNEICKRRLRAEKRKLKKETKEGKTTISKKNKIPENNDLPGSYISVVKRLDDFIGTMRSSKKSIMLTSSKLLNTIVQLIDSEPLIISENDPNLEKNLGNILVLFKKDAERMSKNIKENIIWINEYKKNMKLENLEQEIHKKHARQEVGKAFLYADTILYENFLEDNHTRNEIMTYAQKKQEIWNIVFTSAKESIVKEIVKFLTEEKQKEKKYEKYLDTYQKYMIEYLRLTKVMCRNLLYPLDNHMFELATGVYILEAPSEDYLKLKSSEEQEAFLRAREDGLVKITELVRTIYKVDGK